jgi:hypothetical protein
MQDREWRIRTKMERTVGEWRCSGEKKKKKRGQIER